MNTLEKLLLLDALFSALALITNELGENEVTEKLKRQIEFIQGVKK